MPKDQIIMEFMMDETKCRLVRRPSGLYSTLKDATGEEWWVGNQTYLGVTHYLIDSLVSRIKELEAKSSQRSYSSGIDIETFPKEGKCLVEGEDYKVDAKEGVLIPLFRGQELDPVPLSDLKWLDEEYNPIPGVPATVLFLGDGKREYDAFGKPCKSS